MRQIIDNYGEILVSVLVSTMLILLITVSGIFLLIGKKLEFPQENYHEYQEYRKLQEICVQGKPKIRCKQEKVWKALEWISLEEAFEAVDGQGNTIPVKVQEVTRENGESMMTLYEKERHGICFITGGIYIFELQAQDSQKKTVRERIALSVDNR